MISLSQNFGKKIVYSLKQLLTISYYMFVLISMTKALLTGTENNPPLLHTSRNVSFKIFLLKTALNSILLEQFLSSSLSTRANIHFLNLIPHRNIKFLKLFSIRFLNTNFLILSRIDLHCNIYYTRVV